MRYEREFGNAQRPIIRRIHEHDSSASLPMVLCVTAVRQSQCYDEGGKPVASKPILELSDGWYRIVSALDDCLARAVKKGRIQVGRKLAITGARVSN